MQTSILFALLLLFGALIFFITRHELNSHLVFSEVDLSGKKLLLKSSKSPIVDASKSYGQSTISTLKQPSTCRLSFNATCDIHPRLIQYWDNSMDCFVSPLRQSSGLNNPIVTERRYVVMQPDLGGWNNIRMALEFGILFAQVTGRIFVLPPPAVFYLLHLNKKWKDNFSTYSDYLDFKRLMEGDGLEVITMKEFLRSVAAPGLLSQPLPANNSDLVKKPLWDYLEAACYVRQWSPGKIFLGFNISSRIERGREVPVFGSFDAVSPERWRRMRLDGVDRQMIPYDEEFHSHRVIYFPGHDKNRLLTHFYSFMFFAEEEMEKKAKRFVRDRMRYLDEVYCAAGRVVGLLHGRVAEFSGRGDENDFPGSRFLGGGGQYVAYHVRRGDFQHKQTQWPAEKILQATASLIDDRAQRVLYISTDERNESFFEPFHKAFKKVYFLRDFQKSAGLQDLNPNHVGMVEQVICANAHTFIGTPLSTFTAFITRMRGYSNRTSLHLQLQSNPIQMRSSVIAASAFSEPGAEAKQKQQQQKQTQKKSPFGPLVLPIEVDKSNIYARTYYYMEKQMFQLQYAPRLVLPFWIRDFIDAFFEINED